MSEIHVKAFLESLRQNFKKGRFESLALGFVIHLKHELKNRM
jgi:hypothetical protein